MKKIIYDFGANNGDNIPYYLMKSDLVVAVEANPALCAQITKRFESNITKGELIVENCVLTDKLDQKNVPFYIHKKWHFLSQFPKPSDDQVDAFEKVDLPSISPVSLIQKHGAPHYVKIDIEHYDSQILTCLFENKLFPTYISAESHSPQILLLLITLGGYNAFKLVDGASVSEKYRNRVIDSKGGAQKYFFPYHSAGPYGKDIDGPWFSESAMMTLLGIHDLGWKDIHATKLESPPSSLSSRKILCEFFKAKIYKKAPNLRKNIREAREAMTPIFSNAS